MITSIDISDFAIKVTFFSPQFLTLVSLLKDLINFYVNKWDPVVNTEN